MSMAQIQGFLGVKRVISFLLYYLLLESIRVVCSLAILLRASKAGIRGHECLRL